MIKIDQSNKIFSAFAGVARTLANEHRLILLEHIAQGERSVDRLSELSGLSVANTSQHLQHLRRENFVLTRRDGKRVLYRLGNGPIVNLLDALRQYVEHNHAEIRSLIDDSRNQQDKLDLMSREELLKKLKEGCITLLDVRPAEEFALGHLPGAINIPFEEMDERLAELPANQTVVAYCRGPYCVLSFDAVEALRAKGISARRLKDGFPEWKAAGLGVETSN